MSELDFDTDLPETPADSAGSTTTDSWPPADGHGSGASNGAAEPTAARKTSRSGSAKAARSQKAVVQRAVDTALLIADADASERSILAAILGVADDTAALAVAATMTTKSQTPVNEILTLADADPMEAGLLAAELGQDKSQVKAVWSLLEALGAVSGNLPSQSAKAGLAIARAAQGLDPSARADLSSAVALLG